MMEVFCLYWVCVEVVNVVKGDRAVFNCVVMSIQTLIKVTSFGICISVLKTY